MTRKIILYFVFGLCFLNLANFNISYALVVPAVDESFINCNVEKLFAEKSKLVKSAKCVGKAAKYASGLISIIYAINGAKKALESAKLLMPVGNDFKLSDLLKFPFRLLAFPFKALDMSRCFFISGSFGVFYYVLDKSGV